MKKRLITAAILLPLLLIVVLVLPKIFTTILFGILAALGVYELLVGTGLVKQPRLVIYAMCMALLISLWSGLWAQPALARLGILVFISILFGDLLLTHTKQSFENIAMTVVAGIVLPFLLTALVRMHSWTQGRFFILLPFVIAFLSDTGAYFTGRAYGKRKLAPVISPNKTVEGVIGGVVGAIFGVVVYCLILDIAFGFQVNYLYVPVYGILGSLSAVFGDLIFSAIKRQTGIKDYGNLIPGHGGVLDRFDSMTIVAPLTEVLMLFIPMVVK